MNQYTDINFSKLDLNRIVDFISIKNDAEIKSILELTANTFQALAEQNHLDKKFYLLHQCFHKFKEIIEYQIRKEELILFPVLRNLMSDTASNENASPPVSNFNKPIAIIKKEQEKILNLLDSLKSHTIYFTDTKDENIRFCLQGIEHLNSCIHDNINFHRSVLFPKIINLQKSQKNIIN